MLAVWRSPICRPEDAASFENLELNPGVPRLFSSGTETGSAFSTLYSRDAVYLQHWQQKSTSLWSELSSHTSLKRDQLFWCLVLLFFELGDCVGFVICVFLAVALCLPLLFPSN